MTDHFAELGCDICHELETRAREMALVKEIAAKYGVSPQDLYQSFTQTTP